MLGILVQLLLSWIIVWLLEKRNLSVLGLWPRRERIVDFFLFFFIASAFCAAGFLMKMYVGGQEWKLNPVLNFKLIISGIGWNLTSVLFEELIFRGVLLYILIRRLSAAKAIIISAIAFGIYHWFSFGVIGDPVAMAITFITTGLMGLVLAYGYAKTFSLYIPIGIHFGWNLTQIFVFSQGPIGEGIFIPEAGQFRTDSYLIFFTVTFLPVVLVLFTCYLLIRKHRQVDPD